MIETRESAIGIRADGNDKIGMGHLMRCMSIAQALQKQNVRCVFFTADKAAGNFLEERGFTCRVLDTDYREMEEELVLLSKMLEEENCRFLLADSYYITQKYLDELRKYCPVFYLDDMGVSRLQADGIINYNIYAEDLEYEAWCGSHMKLLLGPYYAPIKEPFTKMGYQIRERAEKVLVTMGGSDSLNIAGKLGECLQQSLPKHMEIDIICGRFNPHLSTLKEMEDKNPQVHLYVDVPDMWNRMAQADIAVSAAGSTMYELSTMGVPCVCCYYVENQRRIAEGFAEKVQMVNAGDFSADETAVLRKITEAVSALAEDMNARKVLSERMKRVTDGYGADHIAEVLKEMMI